MARFQAALPGLRLRQVSLSEFNRFVSLHASAGRLLAGPALAALVRSGNPPPAVDSEVSAPVRRDLPPACWNPDSLRRQTCLDSLAAVVRDSIVRAQADSLRAARPGASGVGNTQDTLRPGSRGKHGAADADATEYDERPEGYFAQFFFDLRHGDWNWDSKDWAAVIYVVVGVVVVGAFVIYGAQALYDLIVNKDHSPVFKEIGLRYAYSGRAWRDGAGSDLYRNANLLGLRFAIGLDRGGLGLGLTAEGGYLDLSLRGIDDPARSFDFSGGYFVAGPMIRFGHNDPFSFNLEFLNGTSDHRSIGWISKARMALEANLGPGLLLGANLGAVFYDLHFFDGLGLRSGNFNRDLSLISGVDIGWMF